MILTIKKGIMKVRNTLYIHFQEQPVSFHLVKASQVTHCIGANVGDNVLSYCTREIFKYFLGINKWNIITVEETVKNRTINKINSGKCLIIGGGGLFLPDTNNNMISGWIWAISKKEINKIQSPIVIFSVGYNYFRGQKPSKIFIDNINFLIEKSSFVGLRNNGSIREIQKMVDSKYKNKIVFQPCTTTLIKKIMPCIKCTKNKQIVALNMAFDRRNARFGKNENFILNQVAEAIKIIEERGYSIIYVAHYNADLEFIKYLNKLKVNFSVKNLSYRLPSEAISFYRNVSIVLGMRGHAQMIPFGLNREIISLGSHDKLKWFLEDIDAKDWYIELKDIKNLRQRIVDTFIRVHENDFDITQRRLVEKQDELWNITCRNMKKINKLIEK